MNELQDIIDHLAAALASPGALITFSRSDRQALVDIHARAVKKREANFALYAQFLADARAGLVTSEERAKAGA